MRPKISVSVNDLLKRLSNIEVKISSNKSLNLLEDLKQTPRSGKSVRIDQHKLQLPKRSIFDHVISLGYQADIYLKIVGLDLNLEQIAKCIVFHDLAESIVGDIPDFTGERLAGELYKSSEIKSSQEDIANRLILKNLRGKLRVDFSSTVNLLRDSSSETVKFFNMVDKTDPIIAIWRYIYLFKEELDIDRFIEAMGDFFAKPDVVDYCTNEEISRLIESLQSKENAKEYFKVGSDILDSFGTDHISGTTVVSFIEGREMHFI